MTDSCCSVRSHMRTANAKTAGNNHFKEDKSYYRKFGSCIMSSVLQKNSDFFDFS